MNIKTYLAPMAGYTDRACRILYKDYNVDMFTTEMVSVNALYHGDKKTETFMRISKEEGTTSLQIFGNCPNIMVEVVEKHLNPRNDFVALDINMGCPAPKIVKNGAGSALLADEKKAGEIIKAVVCASNKPVTLKIRKGINGVESGLKIAAMAENLGINSITVHGRTREMYYGGESDWDFIKKVKSELTIPVIGNGDIQNYESALEKVEYSNCDGIAIGRGAIGNPWIFREIYCKCNNIFYEKPSDSEKIDVSIRHLQLACEDKGMRIGVKEMRKHFMGYFKGMYNAAQMRDKINTRDNKDEVIKLLLEYKEYLKTSEK